MEDGQYREVVDDVVVVLEPHTGWRQGFHWTVSVLLAVFDGDTPEPSPPSEKVVIKYRDSGRMLYSEGPYDAEVARLIADEAVRVIRVLGVDGYMRRESGH
jgi:hypothetical protein